MVRALRVVTVQRGIDPRRYALLPFGGAGPLHATQIAEELGIETILCPRASGVLAALGLVVSPRRRDVQRTRAAGRRRADRRARSRGRRRARRRRPARRSASPTPSCGATYELRYRGQAFELRSPASTEPEPEQLREAFEAEHEDRYGYSDSEQVLELVTIRVTATVPGAERHARRSGDGADAPRAPRGDVDGDEVELEVLRGEPAPGTEIEGPAVVELPESTLLVAARLVGRGRRHRHDPPGAGGTDRSRRAPGGDRRAARDLRGDGRGADPLGALGQHQGAPGRLDGAVRHPRRDGDAGRAHPGPPRGDAGRGRRRCSTRTTPRALLDPQRPLPRRHPPPRHHGDHADVRRRAS